MSGGTAVRVASDTLRIGNLAIELAGIDRLGADLAERIRGRYGRFLVPGEAELRIELAPLVAGAGSGGGSPYDAAARLDGDRLAIDSTGLAARFDLASGEGRIAVVSDRIGAEHLVENALRQVAQLVLVGRGAALLHAAGVIAPDGARAFAFPGRSGAGKSTIAGLLRAAAGEVLSDDLVLLETGQGRARLVATPFFGTLPPAGAGGAGRSAPLAAFHLLEQAPWPSLAEVPDAPEAVARLLANVPFTGCFDARRREQLIELLLVAVRAAPVRRLRFRRDLSMLPLIQWRRGGAARRAGEGRPR